MGQSTSALNKETEYPAEQSSAIAAEIGLQGDAPVGGAGPDLGAIGRSAQAQMTIKEMHPAMFREKLFPDEQGFLFAQNPAGMSINIVEAAVVVLHHMDQFVNQHRLGAEIGLWLQHKIEIDDA